MSVHQGKVIISENLLVSPVSSEQTRIIYGGLVLKHRATSAIAFSSIKIVNGIHTLVKPMVSIMVAVCRTNMATEAARRE